MFKELNEFLGICNKDVILVIIRVSLGDNKKVFIFFKRDRFWFLYLWDYYLYNDIDSVVVYKLGIVRDI